MDIALVLDRLIPGGDWQGSVTANTQDAFDAIRWNDDRRKPSWAEVQIAWRAVQGEPKPEPPMTPEQIVRALKQRETGDSTEWNQLITRV